MKIAYLGHAGFLVEFEGKSFVIDPYNVSGEVGKVDYILITHSHYDHCSIKDIMQLSRPGTTVVAPPDAQSKITRVEGVNMQLAEVGDQIGLGSAKVEALPAYNVGKDFHPKSEGWMGYLLKFGKVVIYHAGDTDKIKEMQKLTGYGKHGNSFVVLLPVSGKYVMTAEEAAEVAGMLKPEVAVPMHYGAGVAGTSEDALRFVKLCEAVGVHAEILEKV